MMSGEQILEGIKYVSTCITVIAVCWILFHPILKALIEL